MAFRLSGSEQSNGIIVVSDGLREAISALEISQPSNKEELSAAIREQQKLSQELYQNRDSRTAELQERLLRLRERFSRLQSEMVLSGSQVTLGTINQFQVPHGRAACACTAGVAVSSLLQRNRVSLDEVLRKGVEVYEKTAAEFYWAPNDPRRGHLSWELQAERAFEQELIPLGARVEMQLASNASATYLQGLEQMVKLADGKPIGCILLVGHEFYGVVIDENDIFIFDSHGSPDISHRPINPVFLIRTNSLEQAAQILQLRRGYEPDAQEEYNRVVFYPVGRGEERAEVFHIAPIEDEEAIVLPIAVQNQIASLQKAVEVDPFSGTVADLTGLFFRDYIYPAIFTESPDVQNRLSTFLSDWMKTFLPQLLQLPKKASSQELDVPLICQGLDAAADFFRDYQGALSHFESQRSGILNRLMFWHEPEEVTDRSLVEQMVRAKETRDRAVCLYHAPYSERICKDQEEAIIRDLVSKLLRIAALPDHKMAEELEKHLPPVICELVNLILSPDFFYIIGKSAVESEDPLVSIDEWIEPSTSASSEGQPIPLDVQKKLVICISEILNLGDPRGATWLVKKITEILIREAQDPHLATRLGLSLANLLTMPVLRRTAIPLFQKFMTLLPRPKPQEQTAVNIGGLALSVLKQSLWSEADEPKYRSLGVISLKEREALAKAIGEKVWSQVKSRLPLLARAGAKATEYLIPSIKQWVTTWVSNAFELTQRPMVMKLFLYQYILAEVLVPRLERVASEVVHVVPVEPILEARLFGEEISQFIRNILELYVRGKVVRDDNPLNQAVFASTLGLLEEAVPHALTQTLSLDQEVTLDQQRNQTRLFATLAAFLDDYARAVHHVRGQTGAVDLFEVPEEAMIQALSLVRSSRGATPLESDPTVTIETLTELVIRLAAPTHPDIVRKAAEISPKVIQTIVGLIANPGLFFRLIEGALNNSDPVTSIPDKMEVTPWDEQERLAFNKVLAQIGTAVVALGEPQASMKNYSQMSSMLIRALERQMPQLLSKVLIEPARLSDHTANLNALHLIGHFLWKKGETGALEPTLRLDAKVDRQSQIQLARRLEKSVREAMTEQLQKMIPLVGALLIKSSNPLAHFSERLVQNIFYMTQSPQLLQTLIYQYIMRDFLIPALLDKSDQAPLSLLQSELRLDWHTPETESLRMISLPPDDFRKYMTDLYLLAQASRDNLTQPLQMIERWESSHKITHEEAVILIQSLENFQEFQQLVLEYLKPEAFEATDYPFLDLYRLDFPKMDLDQIAVHRIQTGLGLFTQDPLPDNLPELLKVAKEIFSTLGIRSPAMAQIGQMVARSTNPLDTLSQIVSAFEQLAYWKIQTQKLSVQIQREAMTQGPNFLRGIAPEVAKVYQAVAERASTILAPLPRTLRAELTHHWQQELDRTLFSDIPKLGEFSTSAHRGVVLTDSMQGNQMKLEMIQSAQKSIVMSGCYLGGEIFNQMLDLLVEKMRLNKEFYALLTGTEFMVQSSNWDKIKAMQAEFGSRFHAIFTPELFARENPITDAFGFSCNHVKALVIDGGKHFLIGGSGLEDRWAYLKGDLPPPLPIINQILGTRPDQPLSFRDMDFAFSSPNSGGVGERLHLAISQMIFKLASLEDQSEMVRAFDPRGFSIPQGCTTVVPSLTKMQDDLRIAAFLTGPEMAENSFEQGLISEIDRAQDSILIAHMYFIPSKAMLAALIKASNRGVRVVVITNKDKSGTPLTHELFVARGRLFFQKLLEWRPKPNVELYEYGVENTTYHKKIFVIDGRMVATGSSNIGFKSMQGIVDWEDNLLIESPNYAIDVLEVLERDMELCHQIPHGELLEFNLASRLQAEAQSVAEYFL